MAKYAAFCEKQTNYIVKCSGAWLNVAEGGKRAGKNVINILAWCSALETHPDKLHLAAGVSNASAKLNIVDSNGFGLLSYFKGRVRQGKYMDRDALFVQTKVGEKIILISGGGKEGDEKYIKGNTYGTAYITEGNECSKSFVKEVFDRTTSSSDRKLYIDINPKPPKHWFYTEVLDFHLANEDRIPNYGMNYEHFTLIDNFSFSDEQIRKILSTYDHESVWYKRDILGLRSSAEGVIYDMFSSRNTYKTGNGPNYGLWYKRHYSTDYGTNNPFACLEIISQKNLLSQKTYYYVDDMYYYDSKQHNRQKEDSEYAEDILRWVGDKRYVTNIVDPSADSYKVTLRNKKMRVMNADNDVLDGIRLVAQLFRLGLLKINEDRCKPLIDELQSYIWDLKASDRGEEVPVKQFDHCLDALRYYCKTIIRSIKIKQTAEEDENCQNEKGA